ncbi:MAG: transposase [Nitrospirota bacterium]
MNEELPEAWCWERLRSLRWPARVVCPHCRRPAGRHHRRRHALYYRCARCQRVFSDLTGTPFQGSPLPLACWFRAIAWQMMSESGSAAALAEAVGVDHRTARKMQHRLAMLDRDPLLRAIGTSVLCQRPESHVHIGVGFDTVSKPTP